MTDLERFIELYAAFGVNLEAAKVSTISDPELEWVLELHAEDDSDGKFAGYTGHHSLIYFDADGRFIRQEFWS